jgi:hypothetical protein
MIIVCAFIKKGRVNFDPCRYKAKCKKEGKCQGDYPG